MDFYNGKESRGLFSINIHHSSIHGITKTVGKWSAGCQVLGKNEDFIHFMSLCEVYLHDRKWRNDKNKGNSTNSSVLSKMSNYKA